MTDLLERPRCDDCRTEMHPFTNEFGGLSWYCDDCGWSFDEGPAPSEELPSDKGLSPDATRRPRIEFGALAEPIGQQLYSQGIHLGASGSQEIQADADAITRLKSRGFLTSEEAERARSRLLQQIRAALPLPGEEAENA